MNKPFNADQFIKCLRQFNAKERFFLVGHILGNPEFTPSDDFRYRLGIRLGIHIPSDVFAAMDYHWNWIAASLWLSTHDDESPERNSVASDLISKSQEDVDFIIAFNKGGITHVILIEAKGVTDWKDGQDASKEIRFKKIMDLCKPFHDRIVFHYVFMSPHKKDNVQWMPLIIPDNLMVIEYNGNIKKRKSSKKRVNDKSN